MTERQLLECFVTSNDPDAFAALIERHGPMVLAVCRSVLREQHDVEDAFQDTFLILARNAGTITRSETIGPWLRRVALRRAQRVLFQAARRRVRERNRTDSSPEYRTYPSDFSLIPLLREEVSHLPEHYRRPVVLCYLEGKTHQEAAAQLRCPIGTIKGRLSRARQVLRDRLSRAHRPSEETMLRPPHVPSRSAHEIAGAEPSAAAMPNSIRAPTSSSTLIEESDDESHSIFATPATEEQPHETPAHEPHSKGFPP
jgi:RNA polymerase sigma factor (sigma-70 family)